MTKEIKHYEAGDDEVCRGCVCNNCQANPVGGHITKDCSGRCETCEAEQAFIKKMSCSECIPGAYKNGFTWRR